MVKYANEKYNDEKRLQFEILNVEMKSLPKKYISEFDHIFSFHTLHWCSDIRAEVEKAMESPKIYNEGNKIQKRIISSVIEEYTENLMNVRGKCMDIGCGPGDITKDILLPSLGSSAQIIGVDISEHMVKYANEKYNDEKRLQFEVLNAETKSLPKKYISEFDHIFSFHTFQWCSDIRQVLKNIYQMLQPNGFTLLYIIAAANYFEIIQRLVRDIRFAQYVPEEIKHILPYQEFNCTRKGFKELLQSEGFSVHHCSLRDKIYFEEISGPFLGCIAKYYI
ncbi:PREDICTED: probable polyketide synthase 40 isoform X2 [Vollenhovia emeryi]|uniref:probable polyketide synthase 40 isoform X2 n=1 Tax=Vollenhovia emeryi TaxID=411798 RepID=UPI0005F549E5|nr:PREDICTED: probable polyketide synthase 40 isoform X2 [Vollenhovia emeryi]